MAISSSNLRTNFIFHCFSISYRVSPFQTCKSQTLSKVSCHLSTSYHFPKLNIKH
ncbi:hypothetical protein OIU77_012416 [Salix suchowensis]|uniref:Uncharacterized protein n=1 Tax=Salix suchowensis TaxID=1278906 RepID=A0ABQ9A4U2_9ROSI|nr:hypothetical protein OIU77_012416 [Salix suchowensis]